MLKKITAIFFLFLFSFNWFGYRIMFDYMQHKASETLEMVLDNNSYDESQLIELKIPVHLPYQTSWTSYQRYNGEIEIKGVSYKYVKRKLANDTLYLKCIPNVQKMNLETAKNDFFKLSNNLIPNNNSKKQDNSQTAVKILQSVFFESSLKININSPMMLQQHLWSPSKDAKIQNNFHLSPEQPPDILLS